MINRRHFLGGLSGVATAAGIVGSGTADVRQPIPDKQLAWIPEYERKLAEFQELEVLGIPRSWWHVRQGLHPFSPERTVIVNPHSQRRGLDQWMKKLIHDKAG